MAAPVLEAPAPVAGRTGAVTPPPPAAQASWQHQTVAPSSEPVAVAGAPAGAPAVALDREVCFGNTRYPIYIRSGPAAWAELAVLLTGLRADRFLMVTDDGVPAPALQAVGRVLEELAPVTVLRVPRARGPRP